MKKSAVILLALCACVSVPMATRQADLEAKKFVPSKGKANLYIVRPNQLTLSALLFSVSVDGIHLGRTKVGTYLHAELVPATYKISTESETKSITTLYAQEGKNYFFLQDVGFGAVSARSTLLPMSEATGRAAVLENELAETQPAPAPTPELTPPPPPAPAVPTGCAKDVDCKGDRICVNAVCVDPPPKTAP